MKYRIDQVAILVENRNAVMEMLELVFGLDKEKWIQDEVKKALLFLEPERIPAGNIQYKLGFSYELLDKGIEFELIEVDGYKGFQSHLNPPCISHFGCHVDDLEEAVKDFESQGFMPVQTCETKEHTGTKRRYTYTFIDTRPLLGYYLKLIKRM